MSLWALLASLSYLRLKKQQQLFLIWKMKKSNDKGITLFIQNLLFTGNI